MASHSPSFEAITLGPEELMQVAGQLLIIAQSANDQDMRRFASWLQFEEAPKLIAFKKQAAREQGLQRILEAQQQVLDWLLPARARTAKEGLDARHTAASGNRPASLVPKGPGGCDVETRAEIDYMRQDRQKMISHAEREKRARVRQLRQLVGVPERGGESSGALCSFDLGSDVEVLHGGDWWNAKIVKRETNEWGLRFYIVYEGGTFEDDEWIAESSGRIRAPTCSMDEELCVRTPSIISGTLATNHVPQHESALDVRVEGYPDLASLDQVSRQTHEKGGVMGAQHMEGTGLHKLHGAHVTFQCETEGDVSQKEHNFDSDLQCCGTVSELSVLHGNFDFEHHAFPGTNLVGSSSLSKKNNSSSTNSAQPSFTNMGESGSLSSSSNSSSKASRQPIYSNMVEGSLLSTTAIASGHSSSRESAQSSTHVSQNSQRLHDFHALLL
jgi:hypothetical protein